MRITTNTISLSEILLFSIPFIAFTIIGTLSHEYGHLLVAKYYGYDTSLHYGSMNYKNNSLENKIKEIYLRNETVIKKIQTYPEKVRFESLAKEIVAERLNIFIGGPAQTISTGTIGLLVLLFRRNKIKEFGMKLIDWLVIFLSFFWLRQVFNLTTSVLDALIYDNQSYFDGDEKVIATLLELPKGTFAIPLGILGFVISLHVVFKIIPLKNRFNFLFGGVLGSVLGYILWFELLGPIVLP